MFVYRITLARFADTLKASGRAARWNANDINMIYTASSQALACLENVVHRNQLGLSSNFKVMTIDIPDDLVIEVIDRKRLPKDWKDYSNLILTQQIGNEWIKSLRTAVLKIPSSIIDLENNYLINPAHPDFKKIKLLHADTFVFDERIKR